MCQYKDIFGKPNEGVHQYRIFGLAAVDLILTIILAGVVAYWIKKPFFLVLFFLLFVGVVLHKIFCVKTALNGKLGLN